MEEHAAFFGVVVPILAILGSFAGSWAAGWVQARGGRDQAAAAREVATATNEAQRVAALWNVRQVMTVDYIAYAREHVELSVRMYRENDEDGALKREADASRITLVQKKVGLELVATAPVVAAVKEVQEAVRGLAEHALTYGQEAYADKLLRTMGPRPAVLNARAALHELRECELDAARTEGARSEARVNALRKLTELESEISREQRFALIRYYMRADGVTLDQFKEARALFQSKMEELIEETRIMLRSEGDVASVVPPQRRWWRRNSAATPTGSA
ncbi:hypothetical protein [Streptomyces omiyaensis]|uniref:Secreted protein n=2 Tax=Streptomyces omiyaensis TaxID=68247 RepID=A0ABW7C2E8_9ACTN|nr:hypothetical protein GCM10010363_49290 [Streptomyces omiyaensis]